MEYVLQLPESDAPQRHTTTLHMMLAFLLFGISITCVALTVFRSVYPHLKSLAALPFLGFGAVTLIMSIALIWLTVRAKGWMQQKRNNLLMRLGEAALMLAAAILFYSAGWRFPALLFGMMAALLIFALYNEQRSIAAPRAVFSAAAIRLEGARDKKLAWNRVERVMLRHNILTISLTGHRIIQRSIIDNTSIKPGEFEQWCSEMIAHHAARQLAEVW